MFLTEAYYGKDTALLSVEKIFKILKESADSHGQLPANINNMKELDELGAILCKKFNFETCEITFIKNVAGHSNAYTIPITANLWLGCYNIKPDTFFDVEETSSGVKFKDKSGKHVRITIFDDFLIRVSPEQITGILLHEIGHNFFFMPQGNRIMANFVNIVITLLNAFLNPTISLQLLLQNLQFLVDRWLSSSIVGRALTIFVNKYFGWLATVVEVFQRTSTAVLGPFIFISYLFSGGILGSLFTSLMTKLVTRGYENEIYADAFAASYGYSKELYQTMYSDTFFTPAGDAMSKNALGGFLLQLEGFFTAFMRATDPHPIAAHRTAIIRDKIVYELNNTRNPEIRKVLKAQINAMDKYDMELKNRNNINAIREAQATLLGHYKNSNFQMALLSLRNYKEIEKDLFGDTAKQGRY